MIGSLRSQTDAGPVVEPEPRPLWLLLGNLQPLPPPLAIVLGPMADKGSPFDPLHVHDPACVTQQGVASGRSDQWRNHWQLRR